MIKIKIKNNLFKEALFKYSKTASEEIYNTLIPYFKNNEEHKISIGVPLNEILYDQRAQSNGAPFLYYANALGNEFTEISQLKTYWNKKNKLFDQKFIKSIIQQKFPIQIELSNKITNKKTFGDIFIYQQDRINTVFKIVFYIKNYNGNADVFKQAIKHELRHINQYINKLAIKYGEEIDLENDVNKMFPIPIRIQEEFLFTPIGIGQQTTGLEADTGGKRYIQGDIEFEPHLADVVEYTIGGLINTNKQILDKSIDSKQLANNLVDKIINNRIFAYSVFKSSGRTDLLNIVDELNKIRSDEFSKKFKKNLKIEIDNVRKA